MTGCNRPPATPLAGTVGEVARCGRGLNGAASACGGGRVVRPEAFAEAVAGLAAEAFIWWKFSADGTQRVFYSMPILSGTLFLLLLWWLLASGVNWGIRLQGLLALVVLAVAARFTFRIEGFEGDMTPRIRFRWQPTPEERAAA